MLSTEKKEILNIVLPKAVLIAQTQDAKYSIVKKINEQNVIPIYNYPFKIGREARVTYIDGKIIVHERHKQNGYKSNNDVHLLDDGEFLQISREHCSLIENNNGYTLEDRKSACGTIVNQLKIGNGNNNSCPLKDGDIITIGSENSKYKYKFVILDI